MSLSQPLTVAYVLLRSSTQQHSSSHSSSVLIVSEPQTILVTTTYELAYQALREQVEAMTAMSNDYRFCMHKYLTHLNGIPSKPDGCDIILVPRGLGMPKTVVRLRILKTPVKDEGTGLGHCGDSHQSGNPGDWWNFENCNIERIPNKPRAKSEPCDERQKTEEYEIWCSSLCTVPFNYGAVGAAQGDSIKKTRSED